MSTVAVLVVSCGAVDTVSSEGADPAGDAAPRVSFLDIPGQFQGPSALTDSGRDVAPLNGCVNVTGPNARAVLKPVGCASPLATFRVIQRVLTADQCVADVDRSVPFRDARTQWTACLDLNWDNTYCLDIGAVVAKVSCDDSAARRKLKPVGVITDTGTVEDCEQNGFPHTVRRFTVCTEPRP